MPCPEFYFAYGSNLHLARIQARVPSAAPAGIGFVTGHRLMFHKRSVDGSSKADAMATGNDRDRVWGALYRIHPQEKPVLDRHEHLGVGYDQQHVDVLSDRGVKQRAWIYVARKPAIDPFLKPYCWYLQYVIRGAYGHRLPLCYIAHLHRIEPSVDSDARRFQDNWQRLGEPHG